jgi:hypothetical protein
MLFDRLAHLQRLNNVIWVFDGNELNEKVDPYDR